MTNRSEAAPASNVVEQEFDALALEYENNRLAGWYKAHADEIIKYTPQFKDGDILDIGCATGYLLRTYLKDKPNIRAVGIDTSATMIEHAEKKSVADSQQIKFIHANWEDLDLNLFKDYKFKAIFCANTFHYFTGPQAATNKLFELLAEDGTLYLLERNKALSPLTLLWGFLHDIFIKDQVTFYKTSELVSFFENSGFTQIKTLSSIRRYFWKNKLFTSIVLIKGCKKG
jgi:ubiquinone/menaquinone biosynthesis C-methylase UbiE